MSVSPTCHCEKLPDISSHAAMDARAASRHCQYKKSGVPTGYSPSATAPCTLSLALPAIITTDLRLNEPRYVTLPNIMKAKKKQLDTVSPADLGVDVSPRIKTLKVVEPAARSAGIKVADVATLVDKLRNDAKVI